MSAEAYIASVPEARRGDVQALHDLVREVLPDLEVEGDAGGIGYGPFHYRYASGREGDAHIVSLVNRKAAISLYVLSAQGDAYLAERHADRLGKVAVGKSCIRIRRVADVDTEALGELLREAGERGGAYAV